MKLQKIFKYVNDNQTVILATSVVVAAVILPEMAFAADEKDAFKGILDKANGWVSGSAGKLITFSSLTMAGIMGVAGFPTRYVVGALGTGLLLSSASGIVNMLF